jgi:hypothetical protein
MAKSTRQAVLFDDRFAKPVTAVFDAESQSSDGGALLLGGIDRELGLTGRLAACLLDRRDPERSAHSVLDLVRQRVFSLAMGYADGNDAGRLAGDPVLKTLCDRGPASGEDLASQPTLSRFENAPSARDLVAAGLALEQRVTAHLARTHRRPQLVTLDMDTSEDPTHGQQQFSFFNGHYDSWCYVPAFAFLSFDGDPEQYLVHARLRPGNAPVIRGALPTLRRLVALVRRHFPRSRVRVRLDAGYASGRLFDALEEMGVEYLVSMQANAVLDRHAATLLEEARLRFPEGDGRLFGDFFYAARDWSRRRRVVVKAEVVAHPGRSPKDNPRFLVTNVRNLPEAAYGLYCQRGDSENRLKELHNDLEVGRTSCPRFLANQLRVLLTATAFVLFQEMRRRLRGTELHRAQVGTLRLKLLKIAARVVESVRRVVLHMPRDFPWKLLWRRVALGVGAVPA